MALISTLQRFAGNRATSQLLGRATKATAAAQHGLVQRNGESAELMKDLSKPKVVKLEPTVIEAQDQVVAKLEEELKRLPEEQQPAYDVSFLGGIELTEPVTDVPLSGIIERTRLTDLPDRGTLKDIPASTLGIATKTAVDARIVATTLSTMESAGQLEYLRKSGLIDKEWKVVIEIHYYRSRNPRQQSFHKDTTGQTLFVNLNYLNDIDIEGPEHIINPAVPEGYDEHLAKRLPKVFAEDLMKSKTGDPETIGSTVIPPKGVVSFVDEAVHHKTPTLEHRTVSGGSVKFIVHKRRGTEWDDAEQAYDRYNKRWFNYTYDTYLKLPATKQNAATWYQLIDTIRANPQTPYNRTQLAAFKPAISDGDIEEAIEMGGASTFGKAQFLFLRKHFQDFPKTSKVTDVPVKKEGRPPLKRQISERLLANEQLKPATWGTGRRTFFRTWIYAIRK